MITRYELGSINELYDKHQQSEDPNVREELSRLLEKIGLPINVSRFEIAQRKREIEARM